MYVVICERIANAIANDSPPNAPRDGVFTAYYDDNFEDALAIRDRENRQCGARHVVLNVDNG